MLWNTRLGHLRLLLMGLMPTVGLSDPWLIMVAIPMPWLSWIITQGLLPLIYIWLIEIGYVSYWIIRKSQITMVIVNKMRIVLTLVNSNLGLYITYLQN